MAIARGYLIPRRSAKTVCVKTRLVYRRSFADDRASIHAWAGVRNLERKIGAVCRKIGTKIAEGSADKFEITPILVKEFLDHPIFLGPKN